MEIRDKWALLVGDNPFHGISHLSQERARVKTDKVTHPEHAASLIATSLQNGANGFMFSVSEHTLSILKNMKDREVPLFDLYAIVPYAYEYVRLVTQLGGVTGLAKKLAKDVAVSGNIKAAMRGIGGIIKGDPAAILKTYLTYEISRVKISANRRMHLKTLMLHQQITDMALALQLEWLFKSYIQYVPSLGLDPGFNTGNFAYLVTKLREWNIDLRKTIIAAPFNEVGFQMNPSKAECEKTLATMPKPNVLAISIFAAGYLKPTEAIDYIASLPNLKGVAAGVSKQNHAHDTFQLLRKGFNFKTFEVESHDL